jgi:WD40 repeat protein
LLAITLPGIQTLLQRAAEKTAGVWLRPLTPSFTQPGGPLIRTLKGHTDWVAAVAITPDGQRVVSASYDRTLRVWNLESGEYSAGFTGEGSISRFAVGPDGRTIIANEKSGRVHFLQLDGVD